MAEETKKCGPCCSCNDIDIVIPDMPTPPDNPIVEIVVNKPDDIPTPVTPLPTEIDVKVSDVVNVDDQDLVSICDNNPGVIMQMLHVLDKHIESNKRAGLITHSNAGTLQAEIYRMVLPAAIEYSLEKVRIANAANAERDRALLEVAKAPAMLKLEYDKLEASTQVEYDKLKASTDLEYEKLRISTLMDKQRLEMEYAKLLLEYDKSYLENAKLRMEIEKHKIQRLLLCIQAELQRNQAKAFKYGHLYKVLKLLIDTVTVANTQEIADIFAGPNKIFEGLHPNEWFEAAWQWEKELQYTGGETGGGSFDNLGCAEGCTCGGTATAAFVPNVDAVTANINKLRQDMANGETRTVTGTKVDPTVIKP